MEVTLAAFQKRYQYKAPSDLIGKGGFSDVYKAWDTQDEQFVALKIATASADEKYDLTQEVKKIKKLKHPNLIEYYDLYEVSTGTKDIHGHDLNYQVAVMEYAEGGTLGDLLKNKPLATAEAKELAEGIIDGLAYLHANNITHRDLKPANILLTTKNGKRIPKITDFGLAKNTAAGNTASTMLVGTVEYMAPEFFKQAEGETTTAAADVWSIGVILLETLTGIHPFGKTTQGKNNEQIIYNILSADLNPSLQNLRAPFKELITRCLIREPKLRPQTAEELKGLLQSAPNDFSERTQIIDYKPQAKNVIATEPKWKKWGKALLDFKIKKGAWKKLIAKELLVALLTVPTFFIVTLLFLLAITPYRATTKKKLDTELNSTKNYLKENNKYSKALLNFSKYYFTAFSNYPEDNPNLFTSLGYLYTIFRDVSIRSKTKKEDLYDFNISTDYYDNTYSSFVDELQRYKMNSPYQFSHLEDELKMYSEQMHVSIDLRGDLVSVNNFDLEVPKNLEDNYDLFYSSSQGEVDFETFKIELRELLSDTKKATWFYNYRATKLTRCNEYLSFMSVKSDTDFYSFLEKSLEYSIMSGKAKDIEYSLYDYKTFFSPLDWRNERIAVPEWIIITLLSLLYPFRFLIAICSWTYHVLKRENV